MTTVSNLPPCRHRGRPADDGCWFCHSPKVIAPQGIVTTSTCVEDCLYVDHVVDPRFPVVDNGSPIRSPSRGSSIIVTPRPDRLAIAMLTAPRVVSTVESSILELRRAGFPQTVHLFVEPNCDPEQMENVQPHRNHRRLGCWENWRQAAEYLLAETHEPYLLLCEDDIAFTSDAALGLEYAIQSIPAEDLGYISLYTPWRNILGRPLRGGWQTIDVSFETWGALAYCIPRDTLRLILEITPRTDTSGRMFADNLVSAACNRLSRRCFFHLPSLCDHRGRGNSAIGPDLAFEAESVDFSRTSRIYTSPAETPLTEFSFAPPPAGSESDAAELTDCLRRTSILVPRAPLRARRCVATVACRQYADLLDDMLGSLRANGRVDDALRVVFVVDDDEECLRVARKHKATVVSCRTMSKLGVGVKSVLYSVARVVAAEQYICLDADTLVLGEVDSLFAAVSALPNGSVLVAQDQYVPQGMTLLQAMSRFYKGTNRDLTELELPYEVVERYQLVVNDGVFAANRHALLQLDERLRQIPHAVDWLDERSDCAYRNQFVFNAALALLAAGVRMSGRYNVQLHATRLSQYSLENGPAATWQGEPVNILHFSGDGRRKFPELKGHFSSVSAPVVVDQESGWTTFLDSVRKWIGTRGAPSLAWSFFGRTNGHDAEVLDARDWTLWGTLFHLIRSNGCVRVLETGTARGLSTACLASAISDRGDAKVVTFDVNPDPARLSLWKLLPLAAQCVIEQRIGDSLDGLRSELQRGARFHAALLDSVHTSEHVLAEFDLVRQLVCPGGLILVHDVNYRLGTVGDAIREIEGRGYRVVRLWSAQEGIPQDDFLGLAVVENSVRL